MFDSVAIEMAKKKRKASSASWQGMGGLRAVWCGHAVFERWWVVVMQCGCITFQHQTMPHSERSGFHHATPKPFTSRVVVNTHVVSWTKEAAQGKDHAAGGSGHGGGSAST